MFCNTVVISLPYSWEPAFVWNSKEERPTIHDTINNIRILASGGVFPLNFNYGHAWSDTTPHLIVWGSLYPVERIAFPASKVGKLLTWLRDQAQPPWNPWWKVDFWVHRTDDDWIWFTDDSAEAEVYLPWRRARIEWMVGSIMNS